MLKYLWSLARSRPHKRVDSAQFALSHNWPSSWSCYSTPQSRVISDKGLTTSIFHYDRKLFLWVPDHFHYYLLKVCASVSLCVYDSTGTCSVWSHCACELTAEGTVPSNLWLQQQCWWAPLQQHLARIQPRHRPILQHVMQHCPACCCILVALGRPKMHPNWDIKNFSPAVSTAAYLSVLTRKLSVSKVAKQVEMINVQHDQYQHHLSVYLHSSFLFYSLHCQSSSPTSLILVFVLSPPTKSRSMSSNKNPNFPFSLQPP